ncbi:ABC transporter permease [Microbacterium sp. ASV49]|uniref:ABC transporter permease n=1 Tax=Microbacterium candidum TaxID=3041922 RepID=A0ABT7MVS5_9MICO|nr:ABC transporter permease [Microbacterium sp. ASV49]MDL9978549.1 ABC transporter permease [Microbacterium sp. ASV49]
MSELTTQAVLTARSSGRKRRRARRDGGDVAFSVWGGIVLAFLFLPIVVIFVYSFNVGRLLTSWHQFGFDSFAAIFVNQTIRDSVLISLQTGVIAAFLATILGTLAGIAMARYPGKWVWWFLGLLLLVSVTPEIVDAVSLLPWLVTLGQDAGIWILNNGIVRLVIGHSLFSIAVVSYLVRARLLGMDARLEEASADLYAPPMRTFFRITLPLAMPAILAGFLLSFTLSLDNTVIAAFVSVSGSTPWPVYILSALRAGLRPEIAAVSTIMLVLTLVALGIVAMILKRAGDSAADIARTMAGG